MDEPNPYESASHATPRQINSSRPNYLLWAGVGVATVGVRASMFGGWPQATIIVAGVVLFAVGCLSARPAPD
ncbi:MAG TPA: hypothetical protein VIK18_02860 [Pirellulales bacterium]